MPDCRSATRTYDKAKMLARHDTRARRLRGGSTRSPSPPFAVVTVPTACPFFQLQAVGGATNGQYVLSQGMSLKLAFTASRGNAAVFQINNAGQLVTRGFIANTDNASLYYVYLETQATMDASGYPSLICQKTPSLTCATSNGNTRFAVCPAIGPGDPAPGLDLLFGNISRGSADCSEVSLTTLPGEGDVVTKAFRGPGFDISVLKPEGGGGPISW